MYNKMKERIYFSANLEEFLGQFSVEGKLTDKLEAVIEKWQSHDVKDVFLFRDDADEKDSRFNLLEEKTGFNYHFVSVTSLREFNINNYLELCGSMQDKLRESPVVVLYNSYDSNDVLAFVAALLIFLKSSVGTATPEGAIKFVSKREELQPEDIRVFEFKSYIDRTYKIPSDVEERFRQFSESGIKEKEESQEISSIEEPEKIKEVATQTAVVEVIEKIEPEKAPAITPEVAPVKVTHSEVLSFQPSRFFIIRNKLITIITGIIVAALGTLIFLASYFYRNDSEIRINEYSLRTTELVGKMIETEFRSMSFLSLNTATSIAQASHSTAEKALFVDLFFKNNSQFVFLGIAKRSANSLEILNSIVNSKFIEESQIPNEKFVEIILRNKDNFSDSFEGVPVLKNLSVGLNVPLLGLSLPFGDIAQGRIVLVLYKPDMLQEAFKGDETGLIKTFMVDRNGEVLAHQDSKLVLAAENVAFLPIVKTMLESKNDNGKIGFTDENDVKYMGTFKKLPFANLGVISTVEEASAFRTVSDMQRRNVYILIIVLFVAIIIVFFFSRTLSVPVRKLLGATKEIENGNYGIKITPTTRDEIGSLTHSFSSMAVGLGEREKLKDAFGRFVNKEIAEQVQKGELKLGGEKKECAIFFSDLRGFTAMSEKMSPEEVVEFLNEYFTGMVKCVSDTHGVVDKYIGDAVMAHWGAILSHGNNAENAVNGALMMREFLIEFNIKGEGRRPFAKFGCGINVGPVVAGQIGSEERMEYTVIGDAVNLASRVETLNKPFGTDILISEDTYRIIKDIFNVEKMPSISVKGKTEPQIIYAVLGRKDNPNCPKNMNEVRKLTGGDPPTIDLDNYVEEKEEKFKINK